MTELYEHTEMPKAYEPGKIEGKWYEFWSRQGYFTPKIDPARQPFVVIMPPTNITGELHLGHALTATLEDIMVRWHRMKGDPTLWLPGVDHAGIATQVVVERTLVKEGIDRHQLGRDKFLERVWKWADTYRNTIIEEHRRLGASLDWSRLRFTMDDGPSRAVRTAFVRLYQKGLIYRGERIVNWCPRCATALSDLETEHEDVSGHLYYIRYPLTDGGGFVTVATTRPETLLGDTAVAVNSNDQRYVAVIGKTLVVPAVRRIIPIIGDDAIDPAFGTGAVKVTPAHDPVDFEISGRHGLPLVNIMNLDATLNDNAGPYRGLERFAAREAVLGDLTRDGLLRESSRTRIRWDTASGAAPWWNPSRVNNGSSEWVRSPGGRPRLSKTVVSLLCQTASPRYISIGWIISGTGASAGSSGGGIASRSGIVSLAAN
jgi:valyl-tRNA synthetase